MKTKAKRRFSHRYDFSKNFLVKTNSKYYIATDDSMQHFKRCLVATKSNIQSIVS